MKRIELTIFSAGGLKMLQKCGIRPDDERYIPLYREYTEMLAHGEKVTYIQDALAKKYGVCPRTVYDIFTRLDEHVSVL